MIRIGILFAALFTGVLWGCEQDQSISTDPEVIAKGESLFNSTCSSCHTFEANGIGPHLAGITTEVNKLWLMNFIRNAQKVINSGDERAVASFEKFNSIMPSYEYLAEEDIDAIIAYMHTFKDEVPVQAIIEESLEDPIPDKIQHSGLTVELEEVFQVPFSNDQNPRTRITKMEPHPNSGDMFMLDLNGKLYQIQDESPVEYMDMAELMPKFIREPGLATGFGSYAFHPDFDKNGLLYTGHTEPAGSAPADFSFSDTIDVRLQWVVSEWRTSDPTAIPFDGEQRELFRMDMVYQFHGIQNLAFNPNSSPGDPDYGLLYIGIGDGSAVEFGYPELAVSPGQPWGSIFRIDPEGNNSKNGKYGIPKDNPFVDQQNVVQEVYAHGFRNPHRFIWTDDNKMIVSNIGHHHIESVYVVEPGLDFGWPYREGAFEIKPTVHMSHVFTLPEEEDPEVTYPAIQYDHDEGNAVCGGYVYQRDEIPGLKGKYIFGDIVKGRLFMVPEEDLENNNSAEILEFGIALKGEKTTLLDMVGSERADLRFGTDSQGNVYLFSKIDGKVYRFANQL